MSTDNTLATKKDVRDAILEITPGIVTKIVTKVVVESVTTATTQILLSIGDQLSVMNEDIDKRFDDVQTTVNRIESKLDATAGKVDDHEMRVKKLEHKVA